VSKGLAKDEQFFLLKVKKDNHHYVGH